MKLKNKFFLFRNRYIMPYLKVAKLTTDILFFIISLLSIVSIIYRYGVDLNINNDLFITHTINTLSDFFLFIIPIRVVLTLLINEYKIKYFTFSLYGLMMLTLLPSIYYSQYSSFHIILKNLFTSDFYIIPIITLISFSEISRVIISSLGKRTAPSMIIIVSFLFIILLGAGLLLLPRATTEGINIIDALFISTSAVCVTGLTPVEVSTAFTPLGKLFIIMLIQIGGLGFMTFTSFFTLFLIGGSSLHNQVIISDMISSGSLTSLFGTLKRIIAFTVIIELLGAFSIWIAIRGSLNMEILHEIGFALFHSISAFCNAGFSTLPNNLGNEMTILNNGLLITISILIIFGGIGFPILSNFMTIFAFHFKRAVKYIIRKERRIRKINHLYNLNTKIVLSVTVGLLIGGTALIALLEWNNAFDGMTITQKLSQAFFNASSPRTAGFSTVSLNSLSIQSILIIMFLMWIGGGSQSTAGGIKVNTFGVSLINLYSKITRKERVNIFKREISEETVSRSSATIFLSIIVIIFAIYIMTFTERNLSLEQIIFEVISAVGTVGLSLDATPMLSPYGKIIITTLMFIGRIGLLTMAIGLIKQRESERYLYPNDNVIIS